MVRDNLRKWLFGFIYNIGSCGTTKAELWVVIQGLILSWSKSCRKLVLEVDSELVVRWLQTVKLLNLPMSNLVQKCKKELQKKWEVRIVHAYRKSSRTMKMLANVVLQCNRGLWVLRILLLG